MKLLLVLIYSLLIVSCDKKLKPKQKVWRFALEEVEGSVQHSYALKFKELIEKELKDEVKVKIYPYGTLGNSDQITEQLATGALQFAMASPGHIGKSIPEVQIMLLHYLLSSNQNINKNLLINGKAVAFLRKLYEKKGLKLFSFYPEGQMVWTTNKKVTSPQDFEGVKMRVMTSPLSLANYKSYGASPVAMPYGEVYSALQLKMIDGQVNPIFAIEEMSFYEVTNYLIFSGCAQFITGAVASLPFWKAAPEKHKTVITEAIQNLQDYIFVKQKDFNEFRLARIKEKKPDIKIITLNEEQIKKFKEKATNVENLYLEIGGNHASKVLSLIKEDLKVLSKEI